MARPIPGVRRGRSSAQGGLRLFRFVDGEHAAQPARPFAGDIERLDIDTRLGELARDLSKRAGVIGEGDLDDLAPGFAFDLSLLQSRERLLGIVRDHTKKAVFSGCVSDTLQVDTGFAEYLGHLRKRAGL